MADARMTRTHRPAGRWLALATVLAMAMAALLASPLDAKPDEVVVYDDVASFLAETKAVSASGPIPADGTTYAVGTPTTIGQISVDALAPTVNYVVGLPPGNDWTALTAGQDIGFGGAESFVLTMPRPTRAAGFTFVEESCTNASHSPPPDRLCPGGGIGANTPVSAIIDSTFEVRLLHRDRLRGSFTFNAPDDVEAFVGVAAQRPFDRMEVREVTGGSDNEYLGEVFARLGPAGGNG